MFEKEAEEYTENPKSAWKQGMTCVGSVRQAFKDGAEFGYNKANEEIREELLELKADSFDAGMFLRVDETLRKLGIKED